MIGNCVFESFIVDEIGTVFNRIAVNIVEMNDFADSFLACLEGGHPFCILKRLVILFSQVVIDVIDLGFTEN